MRALLFGLALLAVPAAGLYAMEEISDQQAEAIALAKVPGYIIKTDQTKRGGVTIYEFEIEQKNQGITDVEVNGITGRVLEVKIKQLAPDEVMPKPALAEEKARSIAIAHLMQKIEGLRNVEVLSSEYTIVNDRLAYIYQLQRGIRHLEVIVDANSGSVFLSKEDDREEP